MILKAIHAMNSHETPGAKALAVVDELELMGLLEIVNVVRECCAEALMCTPSREHWRRIRINNAIDHVNR